MKKLRFWISASNFTSSHPELESFRLKPVPQDKTQPAKNAPT